MCKNQRKSFCRNVARSYFFHWAWVVLLDSYTILDGILLWTWYIVFWNLIFFEEYRRCCLIIWPNKIQAMLPYNLTKQKHCCRQTVKVCFWSVFSLSINKFSSVFLRPYLFVPLVFDWLLVQFRCVLLICSSVLSI